MGMCDGPQGYRQEGSMAGNPGGGYYGGNGGSMTGQVPIYQPPAHNNYNNYKGNPYNNYKQSSFLGRFFKKIFFYALIFFGYLAVAIYMQPGNTFEQKLDNWYKDFQSRQPKEDVKKADTTQVNVKQQNMQK